MRAPISHPPVAPRRPPSPLVVAATSSNATVRRRDVSQPEVAEDVRLLVELAVDPGAFFLRLLEEPLQGRGAVRATRATRPLADVCVGGKGCTRKGCTLQRCTLKVARSGLDARGQTFGVDR